MTVRLVKPVELVRSLSSFGLDHCGIVQCFLKGINSRNCRYLAKVCRLSAKSLNLKKPTLQNGLKTTTPRSFQLGLFDR